MCYSYIADFGEYILILVHAVFNSGSTIGYIELAIRKTDLTAFTNSGSIGFVEGVLFHLSFPTFVIFK